MRKVVVGKCDSYVVRYHLKQIKKLHNNASHTEKNPVGTTKYFVAWEPGENLVTRNDISVIEGD